jgi:putative sugar O-methyltransferase
MKSTLETAAKRFARTAIQPLIPPRAYAEAVKWYYRLLGQRGTEKGDWRVFLEDRRLDPVLRDMMLAQDKLSSSEQSSRYWQVLAKKNVAQVVENGFENFKQTVARDYFTWVLEKNNTQEKYLKQHLAPEQVARATELSASAPTHAFWGAAASQQFNFMTYLLWDFARKQVGDKTLHALSEPALGNPPAAQLEGRSISQDLANSALEFQSIRDGIVSNAGERTWSEIKTVLELGAGYGRTGFVFQTLRPGTRYIIADIPPALYISQRYLTELFPQKKAFRFREFSDFSSIASELEEAELIFLMPNQLQYLPERSVDLFLAIDCLHEMVPRQIEEYFETANRLAKLFYFSCRKTTAVAYDGVVLQEKDYPVRSRWEKLFRKDRLVQADYFETMFRVNPSV